MIQHRTCRPTDPAPQPVSNLAGMVNRAIGDLKPLARLPDEGIAALAARCGSPEIEAAIDWLDALTRESRFVEDWNRPERNRIRRLQDVLHRILGRVSGQYFETVATGLSSPEWRTRIHVAMALDTLDRRAAQPVLRNALACEEDDRAGQVIILALARAESESA